MTAAEQLVRSLLGLEGHAKADPFDQSRRAAHIHPDVEFSLFGPTGTKELGVGRDSYFAFVSGCDAALADRSDEILDIVAIDEECVFVRASAYRKSAATGAELRYQWATLMRVEDGLVTYVTNMLDRDAQQFWGRVAP